MATQKYIGARYMPKFCGTYDATTDYEALSVVDNGAGTTYVANKPVPAGTALTDTEYWSIYGASSGAILDLQNRMGTAENNITNLQGRMTGAEGDIDNAEADIDMLESFAALKGKTIAIFGSSNEIGANTQGTSWVDSLTTKLAGYATIVNKSVNGKYLTDSISDFIADTDKGDYDIVIFCSTRNLYKIQIATDVGGQSLGQCAIETAINSLNSYKQMGQLIYFASCLPYTDSKKGVPMCIYDGLVKKHASRNGYLFLDMHSWLGVSDENSGAYTHDTVHLIASVAPILADRCIKALAAGNEPFANYSCAIRNDDLITWLGSYGGLMAGLTRDTGNGDSVLYCDVNLNVRFAVHLHNNTGAEIAANTSLIDSNNVTSILTSPGYLIQKIYTNVSFAEREFLLRATIMRASAAIAAGADFLIVKEKGFFIDF